VSKKPGLTQVNLDSRFVKSLRIPKLHIPLPMRKFVVAAADSTCGGGAHLVEQLAQHVSS